MSKPDPTDEDATRMASGTIAVPDWKTHEESGRTSDEAPRTEFARDALELSVTFNLRFSRDRYAEGRLQIPDRAGLSTAGGRQARQAMVLTFSESEKVVVGSLDSAQLECRAKPYAVVANAYRQRFSKPLDMPAAVYEQLLVDLRAFSEDVRVTFLIDDGTRPPPPKAPPPAPRTGLTPAQIALILAIVLVLGMLIGRTFD